MFYVNQELKTADLAALFGIKANSFSRNKADKLEYLSNFVKLEEVNRSTYIVIEVFVKEFEKPTKKKVQMIDAYYNTIDKYLRDTYGPGDEILETGASIYARIKDNPNITSFNHAESTALNYIRPAANKIMGKLKGERGTFSARKESYIWVIKDEDNSYHKATEEDIADFFEVNSKVYGADNVSTKLTQAYLDSLEIRDIKKTIKAMDRLVNKIMGGLYGEALALYKETYGKTILALLPSQVYELDGTLKVKEDSFNF